MNTLWVPFMFSKGKSCVLLLFLLALVGIHADVFAQPTVTIAPDESDLAEAGQVAGGFSVTRTGDVTLGQPLDVYVDLSGTASVGPDYFISGATPWISPTYFITIEAGNISASATVTPNTDNRVEPNETVVWTLIDTKDNAHPYSTSGTLEVTLTISDDVAVVTLSRDNGALAEAGQVPGGFTVTRSDNGAINQPLDVFIDLSGTASVGPDYFISGATLWINPTYFITIEADKFSASATVTPNTDNRVDPDETVVWTLIDTKDVTSAYFTDGPLETTLTISDDVAVVTLTLNDGDLAEAGQNPGEFTVTRSDNGAINQPLDVFVELSGMATIGPDYFISGATLWISPTYFITIAAENFDVSVMVTPKTDDMLEGDETVVWTLIDTKDVTNDYFPGDQKSVEMTIRDFTEKVFKDSFEDPP